MTAPELTRLTSPDGRVEAFVAPGQGAELCGLAWDGQELLYRGRDFTPTSGWSGRAPVLWPAIGRTFAPGPEPTAENFKDARLGWTHDGRDYAMPMHGFARSLPWNVERATETSLHLVLSDSDATRGVYPFGFRHALVYAVENGGLTLRHRITASPDNAGEMPFALGNHATFKLPLLGHGTLEKVQVSTNCDRRIELDAAGRPNGQVTRCERFRTETSVSKLVRFDVIALHSDSKPGWARLRQGNLSITVSHERAVGLEPLQLITLWGDPSDGYLSLEAWVGKPNALASGEGLCRLKPGATMDWSLAVVVKAQDSSVDRETGRSA